MVTCNKYNMEKMHNRLY